MICYECGHDDEEHRTPSQRRADRADAARIADAIAARPAGWRSPFARVWHATQRPAILPPSVLGEPVTIAMPQHGYLNRTRIVEHPELGIARLPRRFRP